MLMLKMAAKQPHLSAIFHVQSFSLCDHTVWMPPLYYVAEDYPAGPEI